MAINVRVKHEVMRRCNSRRVTLLSLQQRFCDGVNSVATVY